MVWAGLRGPRLASHGRLDRDHRAGPVTILGTMAIAAIPWRQGYSGVVVSILGVGLLVITFVLLISLLLLSFPALASPRSISKPAWSTDDPGQHLPRWRTR